ncbi:MAG: RagB/SusD family nutrient uptake outer membrane protein, partial [Ferruginibacter sp.]|nr:RagB/SusD family nutrient uptake outer membrane protein [Cytophagales bacterium]
INRVRRRARGNGDPRTVLLAGLDQGAFRAAVARERRVELAFENHRWFDLVRTGQAEEVLCCAAPSTPNCATHFFPFPSGRLPSIPA